MIKKYYKNILVLVLVSIIFTSLAFFDVVKSKNFTWDKPNSVLLPYSGYYLDRLKEIGDGNVFLGNPYFIEHAKEIPPAFFVADWMNYVPMFFGLNMAYGIILNLFLWSLIFMFLSFTIFKKMGISNWVSVFGSVITYLAGYSLIIAPVSMQTIYPFYLISLLALYVWFDDQDNPKKQIFLAVALSLCFYVYTYLWQITLSTCLLFIGYLLLTKKYKSLFNLLKILGLAFILSIPLFIYTYKQITHPYYWESMRRIGLIKTHLPTAEVYYSCRWIVLSLILWLWIRFIKKDIVLNKDYVLMSVYFSITGIALMGVSSSNLITGKELELAQHIVRFIKVWLAISFVSYSYFLYQNIETLKSCKAYKNLVALTIALFVLAFGIFGYIKDSSLYYIFHRDNYDLQIKNFDELESSLKWLDSNEPNPVVVMADYNADTNKFVTILTKHYVLFSDSGVLSLLSDNEATERYLLNGVINNISVTDIQNDYRLYAGNGHALHEYKTHNRNVRICQMLRLYSFGYDCGKIEDKVSFAGEAYFNNLYTQYKNEIIPNLTQEMKKFKVEYILLDNNKSLNPNLKKIKTIKEVYRNSSYVVYKVF